MSPVKQIEGKERASWALLTEGSSHNRSRGAEPQEPGQLWPQPGSSPGSVPADRLGVP